MSQENSLRKLLEEVASGEKTIDEAEALIARREIAEMEFATIDLHRQRRRGRPEVIYAEGKLTHQLIQISKKMMESGQNVLMTRLNQDHMEAIQQEFKGDALEINEMARMAHIRQKEIAHPKEGVVGVFAAGTSDLPVAEEAAFTAEALGSTVERAFDVGVAGIHRLFQRSELMVKARVLVVVAGMEGALPSVVSGLVRRPVIAVPTSVGYGANLGGISALLTMINGCSPGVGVVNIDNGFGAGYLADSINEIGEDDKKV